MKNRVTVVISGALFGLALLTATVGPLSAQEPDEAAAGTPMADEGAMMPGAETSDAQMAEMMDQCLAMMEMRSMMMGMMGGGMEGMEGGEGMQGMEGMDEMPAVSATPAA